VNKQNLKSGESNESKKISTKLLKVKKYFTKIFVFDFDDLKVRKVKKIFNEIILK
jgi:5-methylcytosine-specific restriction endonuclease McrBC GTP-binding regulatory subunit McrB